MKRKQRKGRSLRLQRLALPCCLCHEARNIGRDNARSYFLVGELITIIQKVLSNVIFLKFIHFLNLNTMWSATVWNILTINIIMTARVFYQRIDKIIIDIVIVIIIVIDCIQNLLSLPLISLIRIPHMNSKMVNNFLIKIHLQSIPKWFERISFLNEKDLWFGFLYSFTKTLHIDISPAEPS